MKKTIASTQRKTSKKIRYTYLILLGVLLIFFFYFTLSAYGAYQTPSSQKITTTVLRYQHLGRYDYIAALKNNTVYDNKTSLRPGEGVFFKQLIKNITASFTYSFQIDTNASIAGNYSVDAVIQTNLWSKIYPLVPRSSFKDQGKNAYVTVSFPLDYAFYDSILTTINDETGVLAQNPLLLIRSSVSILATTADGTVSSYFSPSINATLNQKTLEISEDLSINQPGSLTKTSTITNPELPTQRLLWTILSFISAVGISIVGFLLLRSVPPINDQDKELRKMKKKYGEWLVETSTYPESILYKKITIPSLEDLSKVSEELGKPILLYAAPDASNHRFYILDQTTMYEYLLRPTEKKLTQHTTPPPQREEKNIPPSE